MTDIVEQLNEACNGHPAATIPWPHRLLHNAADEIKRLRDRYEGQPAAEGQENVWPLYGYAPGMYQFKCSQCGEMKMGGKRSTICLECAIRRLRLSLSEARATGRREGLSEAAEIAELTVHGDEAPATWLSASDADARSRFVAAAIRAAMEKAAGNPPVGNKDIGERHGDHH